MKPTAPAPIVLRDHVGVPIDGIDWWKSTSTASETVLVHQVRLSRLVWTVALLDRFVVGFRIDVSPFGAGIHQPGLMPTWMPSPLRSRTSFHPGYRCRLTARSTSRSPKLVTRLPVQSCSHPGSVPRPASHDDGAHLVGPALQSEDGATLEPSRPITVGFCRSHAAHHLPGPRPRRLRQRSSAPRPQDSPARYVRNQRS